MSKKVRTVPEVKNAAGLSGIISAKGRVKCPKKQMPCWHEQMLFRGFDERIEPEKADAVLARADAVSGI
ncbi:MAG: hypothetical protein NC548_07175 [Lachnospiraceae bacterium]|nr:hypothetical protein [Lachnospiraceae bacterium]